MSKSSPGASTTSNISRSDCASASAAAFFRGADAGEDVDMVAARAGEDAQRARCALKILPLSFENIIFSSSLLRQRRSPPGHSVARLAAWLSDARS